MDKTRLFFIMSLVKYLVLEIYVFCLPFSNGVHSFLDNNTHPTEKTAQPIYSSITWYKAYCPLFVGSGCLLCLHHCIILSGGSSPGFMNELSLHQRLEDGTDPTVISLQRRGEERELYQTSHLFVGLLQSSSVPPCFPSHPDFCFTVMGSYYKPVTHLPTPFTQPPLTHIRCSLLYRSLALPITAFSGPIDFGPDGKNPNFTPTLWGTLKEGF